MMQASAKIHGSWPIRSMTCVLLFGSSRLLCKQREKREILFETWLFPRKHARTHVRKNISQAQRKVARLALLQAQDEGFGERLAGGRKGLRIVVVKHMLDGIPEADWESVIQEYCQELDAPVENITCISKTKVVIVKFIEPTAASEAVEAWNGKVNPTSSSRHQGGGVRKIEAFYWDGVTDYTHSSELHNPEEEAKRHEDFGKWLDDQGEGDLPPELQLQVAEDH